MAILSSLAILLYVNTLYIFTPQHTTFEQSAACLAGGFESLPGSIPFAILLWHTG